MLGYFGWVVIAIEDGRATICANTGTDMVLADQLAEWLTHRERIRQLVDRHGYVDCPLSEVQSNAD